MLRGAHVLIADGQGAILALRKENRYAENRKCKSNS